MCDFVCAFVCVCWILLSFVSYRNRVLFFHRPIFDWNSRFEQTIHAFIIQFIHQQFSRLLTTSSTSHMSNINKMNTYRYKRHAHTHTHASVYNVYRESSEPTCSTCHGPINIAFFVEFVWLNVSYIFHLSAAFCIHSHSNGQSHWEREKEADRERERGENEIE